MDLTVERVGDVVVLAPQGMLLGGKETDEFGVALRRFVDDGQKKILLDLGATTFMSSIAFGMVIATHTNAAKHNLHFCVCNVARRIRSVWATIPLLLKPPLEIYESREDALQALAKL